MSADAAHAPARELPPGAVLARLLRYALPAGDRDSWLRMLVSVASLLLAKAASVCMPLAYGAVIDHMSGGHMSGGGGFDHTVFLWLLGGYVLARLAHELCTEAGQVLFARVSQRAVTRLSLDAFRRLHRLGLPFHLGRGTGDLAKAADRAARGIDQLLSLSMFEVLPVGAELLMAAGILLFGFGPAYAALILCTVAAYVAFTIVCTEWRVRFRRLQNAAEEASSGCLVDSLLNYETIKHFNAEDAAAGRYGELLTASQDAAVRWRTSVSVVNLGQGALITLGLLCVMLLAGRAVAAGEMTVGRFVAVNTYLLQLYLPLGFLGHVYREVRSALTDIGRLLGILEGEPAGEAAAPAKPALDAAARGEVEFRDVRFSYAGRAVLSGVSFRVPPGRTVAVVGPSGAGKSTLVRLLLRLLTPDAGQILLDGRDTADMPPEAARASIGVVPQDAVLFNDTLRHNITLGRNVSGDELDRALRLAMLERLAAVLPQGLETRVGERGLKLSGGERQRVAIARACLKSPPVLVLDEATSSLDSETEEDIRQAFRQASQARATLVIAHRLSSVADADRILVLENGRIAEAGTHAELLALGGRYAALWRLQQAEEQEAAQGSGGRA